MKFAYLNLKEHPRGNIILQALVNSGFIPSIIIEEDSSLAVKNRNSIISAFKEKTVFPLVQDIIANLVVPIFTVSNHNNKECEELLKKLDIDLIVLGDTRVITGNIMNIPKIGTINSHPGYLPDVKGNNPYIWAIIHDLPQGCSIHFIDENVDTGDIILRESFDIKLCKSYTQLLQTINALCAKLMVDAVERISNNSYARVSQSQIAFANQDHIDKEFFAAPAEVKTMAIKKLEGKF